MSPAQTPTAAKQVQKQAAKALDFAKAAAPQPAAPKLPAGVPQAGQAVKNAAEAAKAAAPAAPKLPAGVPQPGLAAKQAINAVKSKAPEASVAGLKYAFGTDKIPKL